MRQKVASDLSESSYGIVIPNQEITTNFIMRSTTYLDGHWERKKASAKRFRLP